MKWVTAMLFWTTASIWAQPPFHPEIPKTWEAVALSSLEVPNPDPRYSPVAVPVDYYYCVPVRPVYKSDPVYAPGREPAHYLEWLEKQEPEIIFEPARLRSKADWIKAGELVFDAPFDFNFVITVADVRSAAWLFGFECLVVINLRNSSSDRSRRVIDDVTDVHQVHLPAQSLMGGVDRHDLSVTAEPGVEIDAVYAWARG
jgi:hypothetical protein